jgi:hypothetical protein
LRDQFTRSLIAAPHVLFVLLATAPRRHSDQSIFKWPFWIKRHFFFALKTFQILLLAFLLSVDLCIPLHSVIPLTADLLQLFAFVVFALLGLRWAIGDQEQRCKQCLRSLYARPCRPAFAQSSGVERHRTELQTRPWPAQHPRDRDKLVSFEPLDQPGRLDMSRDVNVSMR